uniref:C2H2-type domain-containing protein n=1 Tax=Globodera rostochiensis TaxID=31243 RepID=A0A914I314_GLORO
MVFFICDECGETMKTKQVLQHNHRCHTARYSCMDCQTVFDRESYQTHVKCITEDQKYGGVNHVPKVNKPNCVPATASAHRLLRSYFLAVQCAFDRFCSDCWPSMRCVKHICDRFNAIRGRANADKAMELFWLNADALASVSDKLCPNCDDRLELVRLLAEQVGMDGCAQNGTNVDDDDGHNWLDESEDAKKFSPIGGKKDDVESLEGHDNADEQSESADCSGMDIEEAARIDADDTEPVDEVQTANIGVQKADVAVQTDHYVLSSQVAVDVAVQTIEENVPAQTSADVGVQTADDVVVAVQRVLAPTTTTPVRTTNAVAYTDGSSDSDSDASAVKKRRRNRRISTTTNDSGGGGGITTRNSERPIGCPKCPKRFSRPQDLGRHMITHSAEKRQLNMCPTCHRGFALPHNLRRHLLVVHGKKDEKPSDD